MTEKGFQVEVAYLEDRSAMRQQYGIPNKFASCHTAIIGGYAVEGHVPVEAIDKLLTEKPNLRGIALPGMPSGSPGMDGTLAGPLTIYALSDGAPLEFMTITRWR